MTTQNKMGETKNSTDNLIDDAVAQQQNWQERRSSFARDFFTKLNVFAKPSATKKVIGKPAVKSTRGTTNKVSVLREYWFPILCAFIVIFVTIWVLFNHIGQNKNVISSIPEPVVRTVKTKVKTPTFDIVRIGDDGTIIIAGRWRRDTGVSVFMNKKLVATVATDANGEFVYAPTHSLAAGNYTISLVGTDEQIKSTDTVFIYVSEAGAKNSVSLLMTANGSRILQKPTSLQDSDLAITKIDYMDNGRLVITGNGLPRLRISAKLTDDILGTTRVSDYKHFGLGADVGDLVPGDEYTLSLRMHDSEGNIVATLSYTFIMPQMTGDDDTYYTVRRLFMDYCAQLYATRRVVQCDSR